MPASIEPRKRPAQARSLVTVNNILEAAARNLAEASGKGFTTNAIAARAGVSIGTLYQFFPSKEAILTELGRRHAQDMNRIMIAAAASALDQPLPLLVRSLIRAFIAAHANSPQLHLALIERQVGGSGHARVPGEIDAIPVVSGLLARHLPDLQGARFDTAVYVAVTLVHETIHAAVRDRPEALASDDFAEMLAQAVEGCLA